MRLASAHLLALVVFVFALYCCFGFLLGLSGNLRYGFKFDLKAFEFAAIYMMFIGPFALILMLVYFALLRASKVAIIILFVLSIALGLAFLFRNGIINGNVYLFIGIVWAGVTAALAHHLVYAVLKPRVIKESVSHA
jgi:hypothetical protein